MLSAYHPHTDDLAGICAALVEEGANHPQYELIELKMFPMS
jgi:hypothetical protein